MTYNDLYQSWLARTSPSATKSRMTRTTLKYVAKALDRDDWRTVTVVWLQQALVLLDGAMALKDLRPQSRSNYRNYLRQLYRFAVEEDIDVTGTDSTHLWPALPERCSAPRRTEVAYGRFVKWAIGRGLWPGTAQPGDLLGWALCEKESGNRHWRKDYERLIEAWRILVDRDGVRPLVFASLPTKRNEPYAVPVDAWPAHLQEEWQRMSQEAAAPLRKGGMRPWRPITQQHYEQTLSKFLGWFRIEFGDADLNGQGWATLLSPERAQAFVNWLVGRGDRDQLNPSHTALLRMVRGFHRFLLGSAEDVIEAFNELTKRCEVQERDKAVRMVPYPELEGAFKVLLKKVVLAMKATKRSGRDRAGLAAQQVDTIIFGLLVTRALRGANIRGIRVGTNLIATDDGFDLRFGAKEMKGHRKFDTSCPAELALVIRDYLRFGYKALTGRAAGDGDILLVNRRGNAFDRGAFTSKVPRLLRRLIGKPINAHLFRHIVATHAAQVWQLTPTELAAFLAHRSPLTCMKYYEVTNPTLAAERVDGFRQKGME